MMVKMTETTIENLQLKIDDKFRDKFGGLKDAVKAGRAGPGVDRMLKEGDPGHHERQENISQQTGEEEHDDSEGSDV